MTWIDIILCFYSGWLIGTIGLSLNWNYWFMFINSVMTGFLYARFTRKDYK